MGCKDSRWHLESSVDAAMVVVVDVPVDRLDHLANGLEAVEITHLLLEASVERLNKTILPGRGDVADRDMNTAIFELSGATLSHELRARVGVKDIR